MKRTSVLTVIFALVVINVAHSATPEHHENIIIDNETRTFTINEKNGEITSVKSETETIYTAQLNDGHADAVAFYNDNITIDKASAPGVKPYYRSWQSSDVFYDGSRICYLRVPVKKDKKVKVSFQQTYKAPEHFCDVNLASVYPMKQGRTIIKVPATLATRIKVEGFNLPDNIILNHSTQPDGSIIYTAEITDLRAWKPEIGAPPASVSAPQLVVTGMFQDVNELYRYFHRFTEGSDGGSPDIDRLATELSENALGPKAIADSIATWVRRNIRYLAVEHGEYAYRPASASDVYKNRAGDCKGSANLIKALLRSAGLDGRLVWIGTNGEVPFEWESTPALCSGNHVIAACVLPDTTLYLDGTTTWAQPGYISPSIRGRQVIIEDGDGYVLDRVPDRGIEEDGENIMARFEIDGNDLKGFLRLELNGRKRMELLEASTNTEPRDRELLHKRVLNYPRKSAEADSIVFRDNSPSLINDDYTIGECAVITANVIERNAAKKIGEKIYVDLQPVRDALLRQVESEGRTRLYRQPYGYQNRYFYEIRLPEGYKIDALPSPLEISDKWHRAVVEYDEKDDFLTCSVQLETRALDAVASELPERNTGVKALQRASDTRIVLSPK